MRRIERFIWAVLLTAVGAGVGGYRAGAQQPGFWPGLVGFSNTGACPVGWTEYTAARGRVVVGLPASGTSEGTVGTALTNLQDRTHTHTGPSHTHAAGTLAGPSHSHVVNNHIHSIGVFTPSTFNVAAGGDATVALSGGHDHGGGTGLEDPGTSSDGTGAVTGSTAAGGTGATGTAATSDAIAYIQLMACRKL